MCLPLFDFSAILRLASLSKGTEERHSNWVHETNFAIFIFSSAFDVYTVVSLNIFSEVAVLSLSSMYLELVKVQFPDDSCILASSILISMVNLFLVFSGHQRSES